MSKQDTFCFNHACLTPVYLVYNRQHCKTNIQHVNELCSDVTQMTKWDLPILLDVTNLQRLEREDQGSSLTL